MAGTPYRAAQKYYRDVVLAYEGDECLIWPFTKNKGYGQLQIGGRPQVVSRLVCKDVRGPAPTPKHEASHSCGKGHEGCVTKGHLDWKTRIGNKADEITHGTRSRGERHGMSKLTENNIREIKALKGVLLQREIGDIFGIDQSQVSNIHRGKNWNWLPESEAS